MPELVFYNFSKKLKFAVTSQVNLYRTKIGRICQNKKKSTMTFWVIFVYFSIVSQPCHHGQASMKQCNQRAGIFALDAEK